MTGLKNYKGGIVGIFMACATYALLYFAAFMLAFGNPEPPQLLALRTIALFYGWVPPPAGLAMGYALGAYSFTDTPKRRRR